MANYRTEKEKQEFRRKVLFSAAKLFLEQGYTQTTVREIANFAEVNVSTMNQFFGAKENILAELVAHVLEGQFAATESLLQGKTEDKVLFYAAETTLQLHIVESGEHVRDLYAAAYSMPKTSEMIQHTITEKLEQIFKDSLPHLETKDFYELEIASGGIMRGFLTIPCDMYFTMDRKVARFLETTFKIYDIPKEKIKEAIDFVAGFDFATIAKETIDNMLAFLEKSEG